MSARALAQGLGAWALATVAMCLAVHSRFALRVDRAPPLVVIASVWAAGERVERVVLAPGQPGDPRLDAARALHPDATLVHEEIVAEGPVVARPEPCLALSFVAGQDGVAATLDGKTAYATPDDLLSRRAYDRGVEIPSLQLAVGVDVPIAIALLADDLSATARDVLDRAELRRVRVVRSVPAPPARVVTAATMTADDAREGAVAAARYLARGVDPSGRMRYLVEAPTNRTLPGYDWPRHAGATYFLAQVAALAPPDAGVGEAARRAAGLLRDRALARCGEHRCIGDEQLVDVGSSALGLLAFVEVVRTGLDPSYAELVPELAAFLRAQQRPDGELMHRYDRVATAPVDVQYLYYTGEAALALSRAHALLGDPRDLDAATRALAHLVGPAWHFPGDRYYWGEEHWTCQALDDLWDRAPRPLEDRALDFCLRWAAYGRALMYGPGETAFDADGAYGFGTVVTPRLTPAASRSEAALATLDAARRAGGLDSELGALDDQIRRSLSLLLRQQLRPGPSHLFADPRAVEGAVPGSAVDWALRIDYAQHAGSALVRWAAAESVAAAGGPKK